PSQPSFRDLKFSPDGSKLAAALRARSGQEGELWILPFPSGAPRRIAQGTFSSASWFPDSRRLLLTREDFIEKAAVVLVDTATGQERTIWSGPEYLGPVSVDADGKRIAFTVGAVQSDLVEVSLPDGGVSTMLARGGLSRFPDWAPSGTHYLHVTDDQGRIVIEDRTAKEGFARVLLSIGSEGLPAASKGLGEPR